MRRPLEIKAELNSMSTIVSLTSAFESLSSMKIMQTKNKVLISNQFFSEVWTIYKQLRVDVFFNFGRKIDEKASDKEVLILITAGSGLVGDIDQRLVKKVKDYYNPLEHDIIVIGRHGAQQLDQAKISYDMFFDLPKKDYINVEPLMDEIKKYSKSRVFYQSYQSLSTQEIKSLDMSDAISAMGKIADVEVLDDETKITSKNYILEPGAYAVVAYLETAILRLMLAQFVYDSRLAQLASRFKAMSAARERSEETRDELKLQYNRSKRAIVDTRLKESLVGLKKIRAGGDA